MSGISKCKFDMVEFKLNKDDRLIEKRSELQDSEQERKNLSKIIDTKHSLLEDARRRLSVLKRQNESVKIDEIIQ